MGPYNISIDARCINIAREYFTQQMQKFNDHYHWTFDTVIESVVSAYQADNALLDYDIYYDSVVEAITYDVDPRYELGEGLSAVFYGTWMPAFYSAVAQSVHDQIHQATRGMALRAAPLPSPPWSDRLYLEITPIEQQDHDT